MVFAGLLFWACEEEEEAADCVALAETYTTAAAAFGTEMTEANCDVMMNAWLAQYDGECETEPPASSYTDEVIATFRDGSYCDSYADGGGDGDGDEDADCTTLLTAYTTAGLSWVSSEFNADSCATLTAAADAYVAAGCDTTGTGVGDYISTVFTSDSCAYYADTSSTVASRPPAFLQNNLIDRD